MKLKAEFLPIVLLTIGCGNDSTRYCPASHRLSPDMRCLVLDNRSTGALVYHFDVDLQVGSLSISRDGARVWVENPVSAQQLENAAFDKEVKLEEETIRVRAHHYRIKLVGDEMAARKKL